MSDYLLDTNVISLLLNENINKDLTIKTKKIIDNSKYIFMSGITYFKIKRGLIAINALNKLETFTRLCKVFRLILLDNKEIFDEAAEIYKQLKIIGKLINDADVLIAATAKFYDLTLVSNDADFENIERLNLIKTSNWINQKV